LVVDLSSNEEEGLPNTTRDKECTRRFFGELIHRLLGPRGNSNIIVLSDVEAVPPSAMNSPAPTISTTDVDDAPDGVQDDNSDGGDKVSSP
jgi:hypothetical protein